MSTSSTDGVEITPIRESDYEDWTRLFRAYIDFYESSIPSEQYQKTFDRLIKPDGDLYGLMLRKDGRSFGMAHYYTHQTPWSEKKILHFNGTLVFNLDEKSAHFDIDNVVDLYIDPESRGGGYGRRMIQSVADHAKELGCLRVEWATKHNNPARKLYDQMASCDFVEYRLKLG